IAWKIRRHRKHKNAVGSAPACSSFAETILSKFCWRIPVGRSSPEKMTEYGQFQKAKPARARTCWLARGLRSKKSLESNLQEIGFRSAPSNKKAARPFTPGQSRAIDQRSSNSTRISSRWSD